MDAKVEVMSPIAQNKIRKMLCLNVSEGFIVSLRKCVGQTVNKKEKNGIKFVPLWQK